jgi:hypothetical protein
MTDLIDDAVAALREVPVPVTWADVERHASSLQAPTAGPTTASPVVPTPREACPRWLVAAAVVALLAAGAWLVAGSGDAQQIATGHDATTAATAATSTDLADAPTSTAGTTGASAAPNAGIWRLPDDLGADLQVRRASTSTTWFAFELAVDDPAAPTRWLGILPGDAGYFEDAEPPSASGTFANGSTYALFDPRPGSLTGTSWADLDGPGGRGAVTLAAAGLDPQQIVDVLAQLSEQAPALDIDGVLGALGDLALPEGLVPVWSPILPGSAARAAAAPTQLTMQLDSVDGTDRVSFTADYTGLPPAVASLDLQLQREAHRQGNGMPEHVLSRHDDLGPGTLVYTMAGGWLLLNLFTDDGVRLSVRDQGGPNGPLGLDALLELARRFEVVPEPEFRDRLAAAGVQIADADQLPPGPLVTTTVLSAPGTTG